MVLSCCALNCTRRYIKGGGIVFHSFPLKNKELLLKWTASLRREKFVPTVHSKICSMHFREDDYVEGSGPSSFMPRLKPNSVPSIFEYPPHLIKVRKVRKPPKRRITKTALSKELLDDSEGPSAKKGCSEQSSFEDKADNDTEDLNRNMSDKPTSSESPTKKLLRRKIKTLQQKVRRKEKKIQTMADLLEKFKKSNWINEEMASSLDSNFSGLLKELIISEKNNKGKKATGRRHTEELKRLL